jgi:type IX secretion system PorP/SprF family membrane protein
MSNRIKLSLVLMFALPCAMHAQQFPVVSQYMQNPVYLNPGATSADGKSMVQLLHRSQWAGYDTYDDASGAAPQLQLLTTAIRLKNRTDSTVNLRRHGLGAVIMRDKAASLTTMEAKLSYAYHLPFSDKSTLAVGVQAGMQYKSIDYAKFRVMHPDDVWLPQQGSETEGRPVLTMGLWYQHETYYIGLATDGIAESPFDELGVNSNRNFTLTAGYHFITGAKGWKLSPSLMALSNSEEYLLAAGVTATYHDTFWGGFTYRHEEAASAMLGIGLLEKKRLRFSYAMDYVTGNAAMKTNTSHEVMIGYRWE